MAQPAVDPARQMIPGGLYRLHQHDQDHHTASIMPGSGTPAFWASDFDRKV
jgi:hypothetical protein